jgi:hypothetical protein
MVEQKEEPRLYSKGWKPRNLLTPADDVIMPAHEKVHELLIRWGLWARRRAPSTSLASLEGLYNKAGSPPSTAPLSADPRIAAVELAVIGIPLSLHRRLLLMMYVLRQSNYTICRACKFPFKGYPAETFRARQMVVERLPYSVLK